MSSNATKLSRRAAFEITQESIKAQLEIRASYAAAIWKSYAISRVYLQQIYFYGWLKMELIFSYTNRLFKY